MHGLPLNSRSWRLQEHYFQSRCRNVFIDLRGYGESSKLPDSAGDVTRLYTDDLHALMTQLDLRDVVLVGFASGGHVALRYAARHPHRLRRLVTINASPKFRRSPGWPFGFSEADIAHYVGAGIRGGIAGITKEVLNPDTVFRDIDPTMAMRLGEEFAQMSHQAGFSTLLSFFEGMSRDDDRPLLKTIDTATLIISSMMGQEVPSGVGLYLRQHINNAQLVELANVDHFAFATRPDLVNSLIELVVSQDGSYRGSA